MPTVKVSNTIRGLVSKLYEIGFNQSEIALLAGISQPLVSNILNDKA